MPRYAVFLRGVSPQNLRMPVLAQALQDAGFTDVRTLLSSGNAVFETRTKTRAAIERAIEASLETVAGRSFAAFVRSSSELADIVPRSKHAHPAGTKRVVVFARDRPQSLDAMPVERASWGLLGASDTEVFGFYTPGPDASSLMAYLKRHYGNDFTTRTADTVFKCSAA